MTENNYDSSFENYQLADTGIIELDCSSGECTLPDEVRTIFGLAPGTVRSKKEEFIELIHPEDRQKVIDTHNAMLSGSQNHHQSLYRITRKSDGEQRYILDKCEQVVDPAGELMSIRCTVQDITERIKAQQAYSRVFNLTSDLICIADLNTATFVNINPAFTKTLGYGEDELKSRPFLDFLHPDDVQPTKDVIDKQLWQGKEVLSFENRYLCADGSYKYIQWNSHPVPSEGLLYAMGHDVTEHRLAEKALKNSEYLLSSALDAVSDGIWDWNVQTGESTLNDRSREIFGFDPQRDNPTTAETFSHVNPEDLPKVQKALQDHIEGKTPAYKQQFRVTLSDGQTRWILGRGRVIEWDDQGRPMRIIGTNTDITDQVTASEKVRDSQAKYRALYDNAPVAYQSLDPDGSILDVNPAWLEILGYDRQDVIGKWFGDFLSTEDVQRFEKQYPIFKETGIVHDVQFRLKCKDGHKIHVSFEGRMGYRDNGSVLHSYCVFKDITDQKKAEKALHENQRKLANLMGNLPGMAYRCKMDKLWPMEFVSDGARELTGYTPAELINNSAISYGEIIDPLDRQHVWDVIEKAIDQKKPFILEYRITTQDGQTKWVWERGTGVYNSRDELIALEGFITDITERKKLADQLLQSQKLEAIGRLAGGVAHDFNNMLQTILGYTDMLLEKSQNDTETHEELLQIHQAARRSASLTRQLLAFARKQTVKPQRLYLNDLVPNMLKMLKPLIGENIELVWKPCNEPWPVKIDPVQVDQILANLVVNARDAVENSGTIIIETATAAIDEKYCHDHPEAAAGKFSMLIISDDGHGMDSKTVAKVFEPFFTTKNINEGTGLGLATVYGIVKQNGGFVNIYSEPGKGTTIRIYLPKYEMDGDQLEENNRLGPPQSGSETILFIEDEPPLVKLGKQLLSQLGYDVLCANCPAEAIKITDNPAIHLDLIVSDVIMPQMSGPDLWNQIKQNRPDLKCLFMSGYTASVMEQKNFLPPNAPFIQKPFTKKELADKLRDIFDKGNA